MLHKTLLFAVSVLIAIASVRAETVVFEESFREKTGDGWTWTNEVPDNKRFKDDALEIKMVPKPEGGFHNILSRKPPKKDEGAFVVEFTVDATGPFTEQYQQTGIYWLKDGKVVFKLVKERVDGKMCVVPGFAPLATEEVVLRLRVDGNRLIGEFKPKGAEHFTKTCEAPLPERDDEADRISLQCWYGKADADLWTRWKDFKILKQK